MPPIATIRSKPAFGLQRSSRISVRPQHNLGLNRPESFNAVQYVEPLIWPKMIPSRKADNQFREAKWPLFDGRIRD